MCDYMVLCTAKAHGDGCSICDQFNPARGMPCYSDGHVRCCKAVSLPIKGIPFERNYKLESMPYANCHVNVKLEQSGVIVITLVSYTTPVISVTTTGTVRRLWFSMSTTTARHINRFTKEFTGRNMYHEIKVLHDESESCEVSPTVVIDKVKWYLCQGKRC